MSLTRMFSHQELQRCALTYSGRSAGHVRVFLPQWGYWASNETAAIEVCATRLALSLAEDDSSPLINEPLPCACSTCAGA